MSKLFLLLAAGAAWLVALLPIVNAGISDMDRPYWHLAIKQYINPQGLQEIPFESYPTNLDSFKRVDGLESKALAYARSIGVLPIKGEADLISKHGDDFHSRVHVTGASPSTILLAESAEGRPSTATEVPLRKPIYFSSIITNGDGLHREMGLGKEEWAFLL